MVAAVFAYLALALSPAETKLVAELGSPKFATREAADKALRAKFDARLAILLESTPTTNREAERRLASILASWHEQRAKRLVNELIPNWQDAPYVDALCPVPCQPGSGWPEGIHQFYAQAAQGVYPPHVPWPAFRYGTVLYVEYLAKQRVSAKEIREMLAEMRKHSIEWDRTHKWGDGEPRPF